MTKPLKFNHKSLFGLAQRTKRALAALLIPAHLPQFSFVPFGRGLHAPGLGALGPWVSRRGASSQHAYFPPKYPHLPDLVFGDGDSLFQVQHRFD